MDLDDEAKFACDEIKDAREDFTSLGRWGWGLAITFLAQVILKVADANGQLFPDTRCPDGWELARPFLITIVLACVSYGYFVIRAKWTIDRARTFAVGVATRHAHPALEYAISRVPGRWSLWGMTAMRLLIIPLLLWTWVKLVDIDNRLLGEPKNCPKKWMDIHPESSKSA